MKTTKYVFQILTILFLGCSQANNSNKLDSDDYSTIEKRIEVLKTEINAPTDFQDADFLLFNTNGFTNSWTTLPGASSWDYKYAIKVDSNDIEKWTDKMIEMPITTIDFSWTKEIIKKRKENWTLNSLPKLFIGDNDHVYLILYRDEGIIFKRIIQN